MFADGLPRNPCTERPLDLAFVLWEAEHFFGICRRGRQLAARLVQGLAVAFRRTVLLVVVVLLLSYFFSMALGPFLVFLVPQGIEVASQRVLEIPLSMLMIVNFRVPLNISVAVFFLVLWLLYVGAFVSAWLDMPTFPSSLTNLNASGLDLVGANYLAVMPQMASVVLVAVMLMQSLQESAGVPTGGLPPEPPVLQFLLVSYAPLVEELSYRITTIGFIDAVLLLFRTPRARMNERRPGRARILLLTMWKPEAAKELLGFPTESKRLWAVVHGSRALERRCRHSPHGSVDRNLPEENMASEASKTAEDNGICRPISECFIRNCFVNRC